LPPIEANGLAIRDSKNTKRENSVANTPAPFGGLIASGWHTAGLMTRLFMDHYPTKATSLGSPGGDELRWVKSVRSGDTLWVRVTVLKAVPSKIKVRSRRGDLVRRGNRPAK
jgi:acyl dehydratase